MSKVGDSQLKTVLLRVLSCSRVVGGLPASSCFARAHLFVALFPRQKCSFGARGALIPSIAAVVALELVESRQSEHSSRSGVAKRSSITRTAAIGYTLLAGREQDVPP